MCLSENEQRDMEELHIPSTQSIEPGKGEGVFWDLLLRGGGICFSIAVC